MYSRLRGKCLRCRRLVSVWLGSINDGCYEDQVHKTHKAIKAMLRMAVEVLRCILHEIADW